MIKKTKIQSCLRIWNSNKKLNQNKQLIYMQWRIFWPEATPGGGINKLFSPKTEKQGKNKVNQWPKIPKIPLFWWFLGNFSIKSANYCFFCQILCLWVYFHVFNNFKPHWVILGKFSTAKHREKQGKNKISQIFQLGHK